MQGERIFVGLSGGVDSAVAAALLARTGARVTGVFIKGWYPPGLPCTWAEDRRDAMRVAARLGIPFTTLDASVEYKRSVINYLCVEYRAGRTPNPDVVCNREVKFGVFYRYARSQGGDAIATGHYARIVHGALMRGTDASKDQSYFLWAVPQEALVHTRFPLGPLEKREVRALAKRFGLPVAAKPDSQGICFLGPVSVEDFLRAEFGEAEGRALDTSGKPAGMHGGALLYTLGERVALRDAVDPGPWYVVAKDIIANELTVSRERGYVSTDDCRIPFGGANWRGEHAGLLDAQYRYHGPLVPGRVTDSAFMPRKALSEPAAPGQSIVFYRGEVLVGGGIIGP